MANSIKYNTNIESKALKVNNFWFGTGDVDKGPTSTTGFYNGVTPPSNGYTIYLNKETGGPSIYVASSDAQLIDLTNKIANTSYTGVTECFNYFRGQSDKTVFNRKYESIVTDGLVLNLDAGFVGSYPKNGSTIYDLSGNGNNGTLENGAAFDGTDGGALTYDGTNDRVVVANSSSIGVSGDMTILAWVNITDFNWLNSIVSKTLPNSIPAPFDFYLENGSGRPNFLVGNGNGPSMGGFTGTNGPSVGVWQQIGVTLSGTTVVHYLNGSTNGTDTISATIANNPNYSLYVGNRIDNVTRLKGKLSNVQIYNRALSQDEILQNYNAMSPRFAPPVVTSGLVFNLDASESASYPGTGTTWFDLSGNGRDFTLNNGVSYSSDNGGVMVFDGINDFAVSNSNMPGLTEWSAEAYVNLDIASNYGVVFDVEQGIRFQATGGGTPVFNGHYGTNPEVYWLTWVWTNLSSSTVISNTTWYHVVFTNSPSNGRARVYVNGVLQNTENFGTTVTTPQRPLYIGRGGWSNPAGTYLDGKIGAARLYNKELTASEVLQNYNAQKSRFGL